MKHLVLAVLCIAALSACKKKKEEAPPTPTPASGSTMAGSGTAAGSDMAGSGSAMTGSGSDSAGSAAGSGSDSAGSAAGSGSDAAGSGSQAGAGSGSAAEEKSAFDKLSYEEKQDFMKKNVVPPMKKAFQKFDAKEYANFGCKTCHGKDPKKTKYKMPNPELPKLDFAKLKAGEDKEAAKFMAEVVKPDMAKILEVKEMNPEHPELGGFGCLDCHEQKK